MNLRLSGSNSKIDTLGLNLDIKNANNLTSDKRQSITKNINLKHDSPPSKVEKSLKTKFDKFKPEKKNLKTGSLLALLNFQIKTSPFLMASNVNICEVIIKDG